VLVRDKTSSHQTRSDKLDQLRVRYLVNVFGSSAQVREKTSSDQTRSDQSDQLCVRNVVNVFGSSAQVREKTSSDQTKSDQSDQLRVRYLLNVASISLVFTDQETRRTDTLACICLAVCHVPTKSEDLSKDFLLVGKDLTDTC
jgi:hypothetical protein